MADLITQLPWRRFVCVLRKLVISPKKEGRFSKIIHQPGKSPRGVAESIGYTVASPC
jgi:hypothetical protein